MVTDLDDQEKAKQEWVERGIDTNELWPEDGHVGVASAAWDAAIDWFKQHLKESINDKV